MSSEVIFAILMLFGLLALVGLNSYLWPKDAAPSEPADATFNEPQKRPRRPRKPPTNSIATLFIEYADADGVLTERRISIIQIDAMGDDAGTFDPYKLRAYCHLRRDNRTFFIERIQQLFPPDQEQPLRRPEEIHSFFADLCARVANSEKGEVTRQ
jgi:hypothetical protein